MWRESRNQGNVVPSGAGVMSGAADSGAPITGAGDYGLVGADGDIFREFSELIAQLLLA